MFDMFFSIFCILAMVFFERGNDVWVTIDSIRMKFFGLVSIGKRTSFLGLLNYLWSSWLTCEMFQERHDPLASSSLLWMTKRITWNPCCVMYIPFVRWQRCVCVRVCSFVKSPDYYFMIVLFGWNGARPWRRKDPVLTKRIQDRTRDKIGTRESKIVGFFFPVQYRVLRSSALLSIVFGLR